MWVVALPPPKIRTHLVQCLLGLPVQLLVCKAGVGRQVGHIAGATLRDDVGQVAAHGLGEGPDHVKDRVAGAGAQVVGQAVKVARGRFSVHLVQGGNVALGEIDDMEVVTKIREMKGRGVVVRLGEIKEVGRICKDAKC